MAQQPSTDQNLNERKPQSLNGDGTRHEKNDEQKTAATQAEKPGSNANDRTENKN